MATLVNINLISPRISVGVAVPRSQLMSRHAAPKYDQTGKQEEPI